MLVHGQVTIIFVVSVCLFVCLFVHSFSQPSLTGVRAPAVNHRSVAASFFFCNFVRRAIETAEVC